jgi:UDP:flavonoid glycosyltransferase YjiC (YdhE family)
VSRADAVVAHAMDFAAIGACEATGRPLFATHLFPTLLRARDLSPSGTSLGRLGNALVWTIAARMTRALTDRQVNRVLAAFGLPYRRDALFGIGERARRVLVAVSPSVVPHDSLWSASDRIATTGYWFLDEPEVEPEPELARFVAAGEPPLVVSFGSMSGVDGPAVTRVLLDALRRSGRRAVLQAGWANLGEGADPAAERVSRRLRATRLALAARELPRAPRRRRHHGGGVPRRHPAGRRLAHGRSDLLGGRASKALGVGPKRLHHRKLSARRLANRLASALDDPRARERARALGERVRAEDGVGAAIRAIEASKLDDGA